MHSWRSWHLPEDYRASSSSQTIVSEYKSSLLNLRLVLATGIPNLNPDLAARVGRVKPHRKLWNCNIRFESLLEIYKWFDQWFQCWLYDVTVCRIGISWSSRCKIGVGSLQIPGPLVMRIREECVPTLLTTYPTTYLAKYRPTGLPTYLPPFLFTLLGGQQSCR